MSNEFKLNPLVYMAGVLYLASESADKLHNVIYSWSGNRFMSVVLCIMATALFYFYPWTIIKNDVDKK